MGVCLSSPLGMFVPMECQWPLALNLHGRRGGGEEESELEGKPVLEEGDDLHLFHLILGRTEDKHAIMMSSMWALYA